MPESGKQMLRGLVTCRSGAGVNVWIPDTNEVLEGILLGKLRQKEQRVFAGDWVLGVRTADNKFAIHGVELRRNLLPQPKVANVDRLLVVVSWHQPDFQPVILDGMIAQAEYLQVPVTIVLNKADLIVDSEAEGASGYKELYESLGYRFILSSTVTGQGLDSIRQELSGNLVVLAGPSGVGKSSILNALIPYAKLKTSAVSEKTGRGRHTTTDVRLLRAQGLGWVADTPGFHRVDLDEWMDLRDLPRLFREFSHYRCEFNDCSHTIEPGCGVIKAVELREISHSRYKSYLFWRQAIREAMALGKHGGRY